VFDKLSCRHSQTGELNKLRPPDPWPPPCWLRASAATLASRPRSGARPPASLERAAPAGGPTETAHTRLGVDAEVLDAGCCGLAGSFGYERGERYQVSIKAGERALLPAVRAAAEDTLIVADGFSCQEQSPTAPTATPCTWRRYSSSPCATARTGRPATIPSRRCTHRGEEPHHGVADPVASQLSVRHLPGVAERKPQRLAAGHRLRSCPAPDTCSKSPARSTRSPAWPPPGSSPTFG
jgi:hypothetical protein